jgi:hypothetical protein
LIKVKPGTKKILVAVVAVLVLFLVVNQPQQSAGIIRDVLSMLQNGAESVGTFIRSLIA